MCLLQTGRLDNLLLADVANWTQRAELALCEIDELGSGLGDDFGRVGKACYRCSASRIMEQSLWAYL